MQINSLVLDSKGYNPVNTQQAWVRSSAVEHYLHTVGVTGSIPVAPTILTKVLDGSHVIGLIAVAIKCTNRETIQCIGLDGGYDRD